jgi:hypothetical protein
VYRGIGDRAGHEPIQLTYFATDVRSATDIDTDLVALQPRIAVYVRMWQKTARSAPSKPSLAKL